MSVKLQKSGGKSPPNQDNLAADKYYWLFTSEKIYRGYAMDALSGEKPFFVRHRLVPVTHKRARESRTPELTNKTTIGW